MRQFQHRSQRPWPLSACCHGNKIPGNNRLTANLQQQNYTASQKSDPPKHSATAAANLHRFKWNITHTRRHLFLSSTSNFIRIPYSVYEMFNSFKLLVLKSMARITETRCWDNSCCQPFVQSLVTFSPSSKTVPSPPCPWDGCAIVSWDTGLHQPNGLATEHGWTFWLLWLTSTAMETHDLWVMLFKNSYFSKVKSDLYETMY